MTPQGKGDLGRHIKFAMQRNRFYPTPFNIQICSFNSENEACKALLKYNPGLLNTDCLVDLHEGSYLDVAPRDSVVYLSPHASEELEAVEPSATYVIGGLVDLCGGNQWSVQRAEEAGVAVRRLPLDRHVQWARGTKSLSVHHVFGILLDYAHHGCWERAIRRHVPAQRIRPRAGGAEGDGFENIWE